jgi:phosphatidylinositol 4-kinase
MEFAPSDGAGLLRRQQAALGRIHPHLQLLQYLTSYCNTAKPRSVHVTKIIYRLVQNTLLAFKDATGHPLTREVHFRVIILGLSVLRNDNSLDSFEQWRLKNQILSAALKWFAFPPRWVGFY